MLTLDYGSTPQRFVQFSAQDIQETQYFLNYLSSIINLHFSFSSSGSSNIKLGYENMSGAGGYSYYPPDGRSYILSTGNVGGGLEAPGSYGFLTLIHEFGHVLGLKHPFDASPVLPTSLDTTYATVMSYDFFQIGNDYAQSYMPLDIKALLSLYGSAVGIPTTNFTYQFSATAAFTDNGQSATVDMLAPFYLYDANHSVTLDFSQLTNATEYLTIDLKDLGILYAPQGGLSYDQYNYSTSTWSNSQYTNATTTIFNALISSNTHVANIIGSPLNDVIIAGSFNCTINGGGGNDTMVLGGPGCLNRISASISGASAKVRLPSGVAAG